MVQEALTHLKHSAAIHQLAGQIQMLRGDYAQAVMSLQESSLLAFEDSAVHEDLVRARYAAGQFAECEFQIQQMLGEDAYAERRDLQHMRAECLLRLDRSFEAREILMELVAADRTDVHAWKVLGQVAQQLGDERRVRQAADRLMGLEPNEADGYVLRALWEWKHGSQETAFKMLDRASSVAPTQSETLTLTAIWLAEIGSEEQALAVFQEAMDRESSSEGQRLTTVTTPE